MGAVIDPAPNHAQAVDYDTFHQDIAMRDLSPASNTTERVVVYVMGFGLLCSFVLVIYSFFSLPLV
jgi:hypothetical protein